MDTLVMKFGGSSVLSHESYPRIASIIAERSKAFSSIVVVVSAMGDMTDQLIELSKKVHPNPPRREQDMLISAGERISIALLAMALERKGKEAISFTGSQSGIITCARHSDARIVDVRPYRLLSHLKEKKIVIVAGFQGVGLNGEITTLGRGGSDTSAVALAVALGAKKVEFYKDVSGIFSEDPKDNPEASLYKTLSYSGAEKISHKGSGVLHSRSIGLAKQNGIPLHVLSHIEFTRNADIKELGTLITGKERNSDGVFEPLKGDQFFLDGECI